MLRLTYEEIDYRELTESVRADEAGAVVLFLGTVRDLTQQKTGEKRTTALEYEAYAEMAEAKMAELLDEAKRNWPVHKAALAHRLGRLEPGEISVAVAVSCPHRREAFAAGQWIIDELKVRVPIWKQENFADGSAEWVHPCSTP